MTGKLELISTSLNRTTSEDLNSLLKTFFEGLREQTVKAYRSDLEDFRTFINVDSLEAAADHLFSSGHGFANQIAFSYRAHLINSGRQSTTINRKLASLRSLVALARMLGIVSWELEVKNLKVQAYRDTRGPGQSTFQMMLSEAGRKGDAKAIRDHAILRLLYDLALRASEVINIDVTDVDLGASTIAILGKGRTQKQLLTLPEPTKAALFHWLNHRCDPTGMLNALFLNFDRSAKGQSKRLTRAGLYQLVRGLGERLNIKTRPHAIRHTSITEACKLAQNNGYGLEEVLDYSRHANVSTLMIYRDRERNAQGKIASLVAAAAK